MSDVARRLRENATSIVSTLVTGIWLAALLLGFEWWLPVMLFGYIALIPIVSILSGEDEEEEAVDRQEQTEETTAERQQGADASTEDALQTLRDRYARGELTDEQFERTLERLLETETLEDSEDRYPRERPATQAPQGAERRKRAASGWPTEGRPPTARTASSRAQRAVRAAASRPRRGLSQSVNTTSHSSERFLHRETSAGCPSSYSLRGAACSWMYARRSSSLVSTPCLAKKFATL